MKNLLKYPYDGPYPSNSQRLYFHSLIKEVNIILSLCLSFTPFILSLIGLSIGGAIFIESFVSLSSQLFALAGVLTVTVTLTFILFTIHTKFMDTVIVENIIDWFMAQISEPATMKLEE